MRQEWIKQVVKIVPPVLAPAVLIAALNFQQLCSAWSVWMETQQLAKLAENIPEDLEKSTPLIEDFEEGLSMEFWDFMIINGAGMVIHETAWHVAEMVIDHQLTLWHALDPQFATESAEWQETASEQSNNVTLIGGSGFQPTSSGDVVALRKLPGFLMKSPHPEVGLGDCRFDRRRGYPIPTLGGGVAIRTEVHAQHAVRG